MFDNIFGKCKPIFKILSPSDLLRKFYMYTITKISTWPAVCCMSQVENPKMLPNFHIERDN